MSECISVTYLRKTKIHLCWWYVRRRIRMYGNETGCLKIHPGNYNDLRAFGFSWFSSLTWNQWPSLQRSTCHRPCSALWRCYPRRAVQDGQVYVNPSVWHVIWWCHFLIDCSNKRQAQNVAVGEQLGRHLQPAASDHLSLRGTAASKEMTLHFLDAHFWALSWETHKQRPRIAHSLPHVLA